MSSYALKPISQIAYVVPNLHEAIRHWTRTLNIGPFILIPHIPYRHLLFEGQPSAPDVSIALAYSGGMQIELVEQHNDQPSVFLPFRHQRANGMHHTAVHTATFEEDEAHLVAAGMRRLQHNIAADSGAETVFLAGGDVFPGIFELIRLSQRGIEFNAWLQESAQRWDGETETVKWQPPMSDVEL